MHQQKPLFGHYLSSFWFRVFLNLYPPLLGAGIKVEKIANDFGRFEASLKLRWYNKNYIGTHFGGSLFAMTDPFCVIILLKKLGSGYVIWDKSASIEYLKPGHGTVRLTVEFSDEQITSIKEKADAQGKYLFDKKLTIVNEEGIAIASVTRTIYVRNKASSAR